MRKTDYLKVSSVSFVIRIGIMHRQPTKKCHSGRTSSDKTRPIPIWLSHGTIIINISILYEQTRNNRTLMQFICRINIHRYPCRGNKGTCQT